MLPTLTRKSPSFMTLNDPRQLEEAGPSLAPQAMSVSGGPEAPASDLARQVLRSVQTRSHNSRPGWLLPSLTFIPSRDPASCTAGR